MLVPAMSCSWRPAIVVLIMFGCTSVTLFSVFPPITVSQPLTREASGIMEPQHDVYWRKDDAWFKRQSGRGCCPYAQILYQHRYGYLRYRCCDDRLDEIEPLRPIGGVRFDDPLAMTILQNKTVYIQGDSMAEQHFLSMLCLAWADGITVDLRSSPSHENSSQRDPTEWTALIGSNVSGSMRIDFHRVYHPSISSTIDISDEAYDFVILVGWHHGSLNHLHPMITETAALRTKRPTIIVDPLPSHFPGGVHHPDGIYPTALDDSQRVHNYCDQGNGIPNPNIISNLTDWIDDIYASQSLFAAAASSPRNHLYRIQASHLYTERGDAHIGIYPPGPKGNRARDCLHFCVAPGVLDALAMETLRVMVKARNDDDDDNNDDDEI